MKRNKFSLSHYKLLSCDMGELVPIGLTEVLPGDTWQHNTNLFMRLAPMLAPVMHPVEARVHHWFVPHRLVWDGFEDFITGGPDGMDNTAFPTRALTYTNPTTGQNIVGQLPDYLGVPPGLALTTSALPFRGYGLIFNEWYRDQDLVTKRVVSTASGVDTTTDVSLAFIAWEKDYFTAARPWEQKGPSITIPLGNTAPLKYNPASPGATNPTIARNITNQGVFGAASWSNTGAAGEIKLSGGAVNASFDVTGHTVADLSNASAITVTALREALALQRYEENRARYGSRYVEYLRYLGVRSSDARLQRPEYLGGGRQTLQFSEVLATAEGTNTDVGDLKGHGIGAVRSNRYRRHFEEHGYVYTLLSVRPKTMYVQGLPRTWNRREKEDFWQDELQHIGQQEILRKEIYAGAASPDATFGFSDRYAEYRSENNTIAGEFRSTTLDYWHMARIFGSEPSLNSSFVTSVPTERIFAVSTNDVLYVMAKHSIQARRLVASSPNSFIY